MLPESVHRNSDPKILREELSPMMAQVVGDDM